MIALLEEFVDRVFVVDDNKDLRDTTCDLLKDEGINAIPVSGPFETGDELVDFLSQERTATISDYRLRDGGYSPIDGGETVARLYKRKFPAILMSRWVRADIEALRGLRHQMPVVLPAEHTFDVSSFSDAVSKCLNEFDGQFTPERKPYRTMVCVEDIIQDGTLKRYDVTIPGWNPNEVVRLPSSVIPLNIVDKVAAGSVLFANVNKGAASSEDLYFTDFEMAP